MKWSALVYVAAIALSAGCQVEVERDGVTDAVYERERAMLERGGPNAQICGGFGGLECDEGYTCVDDPKDNCDPDRGGADCAGICKKTPGGGNGNGNDRCRDTETRTYLGYGDECLTIRYFCEPGTQPFFDDCGCGCEVVLGEACNTDTCGEGEYCCNYSCGICAPEGGVCTQQVCEPTL